MNVSWHQLRQLQSVLHKTQTKRFAGKRKTPKYGSLSKAFSDSQLERFLRVIGSDKFRLLFGYQAQLGLRIGEAIRVNNQLNRPRNEGTHLEDREGPGNGLVTDTYSIVQGYRSLHLEAQD